MKQNQIEKKAIIFDFDGTLVDTYELIIDGMNILSSKYNLPILNTKQIEKLRDKSLKDIFKEDLKLKWYQYPFFIRNVQKVMKDEIKKVKFHTNIISIIKELSKTHKIFILSSNHREIIENELNKNNIDFIQIVYSNSSMFKKDKSILNLIEISKLKLKDVIYVGDEIRDIEACKKINVPIISVTWGFNSRKILSTHNPEFLIDKPQELIEIFK